jgi:formamidopyrimidine-DNA glycosylase
MPELPEVETIVCGLREKLRSLEFCKVEVYLEKCIRGSKRPLLASLKGRKILRVERRGKNIIFHLSGRAALLVHLRMTGRLRFVPAHTPQEKHTHVIFSFKNHPGQLRFVDPRQFGRLVVEREGAGDELSFLADLGPEPFEIPAKEFIQRARAKHRAIKPLLLDQRFLAGVGNIYADEALYQAQIHPLWRADALSEKSLHRLYYALRRILREAIRAGGTSVRTYVDASGSTGTFQRSLRVYGREGKTCRSCGELIVRERVAGRSSFFCPRCQPRPPLPEGKTRGKQE